MTKRDLTEDEIAFLKSASSVPEEIRHFVARQHDQIGLRSSAYAKIAAAARAEGEALLAVRMLAALQGEMSDLAEARKAAITAESTVRQLTEVVGQKDRQIETLMARDSLAVYSED